MWLQIDATYITESSLKTFSKLRIYEVFFCLEFFNNRSLPAYIYKHLPVYFFKTNICSYLHILQFFKCIVLVQPRFKKLLKKGSDVKML